MDQCMIGPQIKIKLFTSKNVIAIIIITVLLQFMCNGIGKCICAKCTFWIPKYVCDVYKSMHIH